MYWRSGSAVSFRFQAGPRRARLFPAPPPPASLPPPAGQPHNTKGGQPAGQVALGPYFIPGHAGQAQRAHLTEHKNRRPFSIQHQYTTEKGRLPRKTSLGDAQLWVR